MIDGDDANLRPPRHKYEALYKLSPGLYDGVYNTRKLVVNKLFIMRNSRLMLKKVVADEAYQTEFKAVMEGVKQTAATVKSDLKDGEITADSGLYLYQLIRSRKPKLILETGVANGLSTRIALEALAKNGDGMLISAEVNQNVGTLVTAPLKARWKLVVGEPEKVLGQVLDGVDKIDIFLHDSDHSYANIKNELNSVKGKMSQDGVFLGDDIDENNAFLEFAASIGKTPQIIPSSTKCFGILFLDK